MLECKPTTGQRLKWGFKPSLLTPLLPTRPLCPRCESESELAQSCPNLCNPMDLAYNAPLSMGFSSQEYWSGLPFPSSLFIIPQVTSIQYCPEAGLNPQGFLCFSLTLKTMQDHHSNVRQVVCRFLYMVKSWKKFRVPWHKCFISQKMKKYIIWTIFCSKKIKSLFYLRLRR